MFPLVPEVLHNQHDLNPMRHSRSIPSHQFELQREVPCEHIKSFTRSLFGKPIDKRIVVGLINSKEITHIIKKKKEAKQHRH